jgi:hypothetical protein
VFAIFFSGGPRAAISGNILAKMQESVHCRSTHAAGTKLLRIALFTLESLANAAAVRRFVSTHRQDLVLVGLSDPFRKSMGGMLGQTWRHLKRSGPRWLPYLAANFSLPRLRGALFSPRRALEAEATPLRELCAAHGIPASTIDDVNSGAIKNLLKKLEIDLLVSFHFDQIFDADILNVPPLGGINVHPSLLPSHRGPVPTLYALLEPSPPGNRSICPKASQHCAPRRCCMKKAKRC